MSKRPLRTPSVLLGVAVILILVSCEGGNSKEEPTAQKTKEQLGSQQQAAYLHVAAVNADVKEVRRLISQGADVNARQSDGATPLHAVAWAGYRLALRKGDLAPCGGVGHVAGRIEDLKLVAEILIEKGAHVNAKDVFNVTPLHVAAFHGNEPVARVLIDHGAAINVRDDKGTTPLSTSITCAHHNITELLKEHGAEIGITGELSTNRAAAPGSIDTAALTVSALEGDAESQYRLAVLYATGEGVAQDQEEATQWFLRAATAGFVTAQYDMGVRFAEGIGTRQDYQEAVMWYRLAAGQGYAAAQFNLGVHYANGRGVPQDYSEAARWYRMAAEKGDAWAQVNLGIQYARGQGVPYDRNEAAKWFRKAADQGNKTGREALEALDAE